RQTSAADDGCRIDVGERRLERRQGGKRASCWRGGDLLAPGPFVFAIVVGVIAVAIMMVVVAHAFPPGRLRAPRKTFAPARPVRAPGRARSHSAPGRPRSGAKRSILVGL